MIFGDGASWVVLVARRPRAPRRFLRAPWASIACVAGVAASFGDFVGTGCIGRPDAGPARSVFATVRVIGLVAFGATFLGSSSARASDAMRAEELFERGRRAMVAAEYAVARTQFEASYEMEPALGTLLNLAVCEEKLGLLSTAFRHLGQALQMAAVDDRRRPSIGAHFDELASRIPRLTIRSHGALPADVVISLDGIPVDRATLGTSLPIDPGVHTIRCDGERGAVCMHEFEVRDRQSVEWLAMLDPQPVATGPAPEREARGTTNAPGAGAKGHDHSALAFWIGGASLASLVLGLAAGAEVLHLKSIMDGHCDARHCDSEGTAAVSSGPTWSWVSTIAVGVGAVGLGTSVIIALPRPSPVPSAELTIHGHF